MKPLIGPVIPQKSQYRERRPNKHPNRKQNTHLGAKLPPPPINPDRAGDVEEQPQIGKGMQKGACARSQRERCGNSYPRRQVHYSCVPPTGDIPRSGGRRLRLATLLHLLSAILEVMCQRAIIGKAFECLLVDVDGALPVALLAQ